MKNRSRSFSSRVPRTLLSFSILLPFPAWCVPSYFFFHKNPYVGIGRAIEAIFLPLGDRAVLSGAAVAAGPKAIAAPEQGLRGPWSHAEFVFLLVYCSNFNLRADFLLSNTAIHTGTEPNKGNHTEKRRRDRQEKVVSTMYLSIFIQMFLKRNAHIIVEIDKLINVFGCLYVYVYVDIHVCTHLCPSMCAHRRIYTHVCRYVHMGLHAYTRE